MAQLFDENYQLFVQEKVKIDPANKQQIISKEFELLLRNKENNPKYPTELIASVLSSKEEYKQFLLWFAQECVRLLKEYEKYHFSINISIDQISYSETMKLFDYLAKYRDRITVELSEDALDSMTGFQKMNREEKHKERIKRVKKIYDLGFKLSADDVGSGLNSLDTVASIIPYLYEVKYSLVNFRKLYLEEEQVLSFLYTWKNLADCYELKFVVEGVESAEEVNELIKNNVRYFQGYFFEKPHKM